TAAETNGSAWGLLSPRSAVFDPVGRRLRYRATGSPLRSPEPVDLLRPGGGPTQRVAFRASIWARTDAEPVPPGPALDSSDRRASKSPLRSVPSNAVDSLTNRSGGSSAREQPSTSAARTSRPTTSCA